MLARGSVNECDVCPVFNCRLRFSFNLSPVVKGKALSERVALFYGWRSEVIVVKVTG